MFMLDSYNREINYMRISVTDRCNLNCIYCKPDSSLEYIEKSKILSYEDIEAIVRICASKFGIDKIRLTGGEPLLRNDIHVLIKKISSIKNIKEICLTTNGILLSNMAKTLKESGLTSINISLDTLDETKYESITGHSKLKDVLNGIETAIKHDIKTKLNIVMFDEESEKELKKIETYAKKVGAKVQTIKYYNINKNKETQDIYDRPPKCSCCNKIRLLADGTLLSCLHSTSTIKIDMNNIEESIKKAIIEKPMKGLSSNTKSVSLIGG